MQLSLSCDIILSLAQPFTKKSRIVITTERTYAMLGNQTLWDAVVRCHETLAVSGISHAIVGGVAVCLHGYRRNTVDVDLLVRREDVEAIRSTLEAAGFEWSAQNHEFLSPSGVPIQFLLTGDRAGNDSEVRFPDPGVANTVVQKEGLPVLSLARLIESKLACGAGNLRRTHKDFADVIELIDVNQLPASFVRLLHKSVRESFRELLRRTRAG